MNYGKLIALASLVLLGACGASPTKASDGVIVTPVATARSATPQDQANSESTQSDENASPNEGPIADSRQSPIDRSPSPKQPEYCAPGNYRQFFHTFVRDNDMKNNRMRAPHTSAKIQVRDYNNPQNILEVVSKEDYQGFKISVIDYTMVYDDRSIANLNSKARLKLDFTSQTKDVFRVNYVRAEFETDPEAEDNNGKLIRTYGAPGAYIFAHRNSCWNLTEEHRTVVSGTDRTAGPSAAFLEGELTKGMAYADLRKTALGKGWVPLASPNCQDNTGGRALVCTEIPEVNACSGGGYCLMFFKHQDSGTRLSVTTYGPYDDWQTPGRASRLRVKGWGIGDAAAPLN